MLVKKADTNFQRAANITRFFFTTRRDLGLYLSVIKDE